MHDHYEKTFDIFDICIQITAVLSKMQISKCSTKYNAMRYTGISFG